MGKMRGMEEYNIEWRNDERKKRKDTKNKIQVTKTKGSTRMAQKTKGGIGERTESKGGMTEQEAREKE